MAQLLRTWRVLLLSQRAADGYGATRQDAIRSFHTHWFCFPYAMITGYVVEEFYINKFDVPLAMFFTLKVWSYVVVLAASVWLVKVHAEWQGAGPNFYRWVVGFNWMNALIDLLLLPLFLISIIPMWSRTELIVMGTTTYIFIILATWAVTWRTLKVNPFFAGGVAMIPIIVNDMLFNFTNYKMYGSIRPFFDLP
jgi:hypothetical protein